MVTPSNLLETKGFTMTMQEKYERVKGKHFAFSKENFELLAKHFKLGAVISKRGFLKDNSCCLSISEGFYIYCRLLRSQRKCKHRLEDPRNHLATLIDPRNLR